MPQLLLELFSEEIPARMQAAAADDLKRLMLRALNDRGLGQPDARAYVTPRRLTLVIDDLPAASADVREELKGPRTNAPEAALAGFLKKTGLTKDQLTTQADAKGEVYIAIIERPGRPAPALIAEAAIETIKSFPWPKSMTWEPSGLSWVRPLRSILCLFDGQVVPFQIAGLTASNVTRGHRQMANEPFEVRDFADYEMKLRERRVILDRAERMEMIEQQALNAAANAGLVFRDDDELLEEVAGLVEYPVVLTGAFEPAFLSVPQEVLISTMRKNQKYFALYSADGGSNLRHGEVRSAEREASNHAQGSNRPASFETQPPAAPQDDESGANGGSNLRHGEEGATAPVSNHALTLSNRFLIVSNLEARDGGAAIVAGNEKVIRARLSDAKFFWEQDLKKKLEPMHFDLKGITFHAKLGTQWDRVQRIERLAGEIAERIGANAHDARLAARLCKADLVSGTVGEFPEVQGIIGGYLARAEGLGDAVANAIADHYRPQGPSDRVPTELVSVAVALADKLDTLAGFFAAGEKPTGSKDPFALRRAALGVVRCILETEVRIPLNDITDSAATSVLSDIAAKKYASLQASAQDAADLLRKPELTEAVDDLDEVKDGLYESILYGSKRTRQGLAEFVGERLRVALKEQGKPFHLLDSVFALSSTKDPVEFVFALGGQDDLVLLVRRVEALQRFLATDDGANLLAGYKRAANILRIEEKKDKVTYDGGVDPDWLVTDADKALFAAIATANELIEAEIAKEDFDGAMRVLAGLRGPVDAFFDLVKINDDDAAVRLNRLNLLARIKSAAHLVADFSKIEG